jgi:major membrane immunogen (membrane-anchored lipoprotein)
VKKFKKAMALSLALAMGLSLVACGKDDSSDDSADKTSEEKTEVTEVTEEDTEEATTKEESATQTDVSKMEMTTGNGKPIHVYAWNNETGDLIKQFLYADYPELEDLVITHDLGVGGTDPEYITKLKNQFSTDEAPSIIAADIDAAKNLMEQDFIVPLADIGFDESYYANAYDYTVEFATNDAGQLMGATWQVTPGVVCYRTDIAEEVLGFSDPDKVSEAISSWDKFFDVAAKVKDAGYYMLSGVDDIKYPMLDSRSEAWVVDGTLKIDASIDKYLEYSKKLKDEGYTKETTMWQGDWTPNMSDDVFCYFGTTWFVPFSLSIDDTDAFGKYNVCEGPVQYHWGGSFLMAAKDSPNPELAAFVIYYMTCDEDHLYEQATTENTMNYPNNKKVAQELIDAGEGSMEKLGGQNPYPLYDELLSSVDLSLSTKYDNQLNGYLDTAVSGYVNGDYSNPDEAKDYIMSQVADNLPDINIE